MSSKPRNVFKRPTSSVSESHATHARGRAHNNSSSFSTPRTRSERERSVRARRLMCMQGGRWLGQVLGPARSPSGSMCLCGRSSARSSAPPVHVGCMDGLQASHARRGAAGQIAAGFQLGVRAHLSPAALVRVGLGVRQGHVGLSCVTEITRMVFFARVTPLNPTWTGPNAPHALKSAFRATHTTSHSACVAARGSSCRR